MKFSLKNNLNELAKEIVEKNEYLALSTSDLQNNPWVSPVAYAYDENGAFYFVSVPASRHIQNILKNNKISFAIYDSHQDWGMGIGLQVEGTVEQVKLKDLPKVMSIYFRRNYPYGSITKAFVEGLKKLLANKTYNFYQINPTVFWMNNPNADVDERIEATPF